MAAQSGALRQGRRGDRSYPILTRDLNDAAPALITQTSSRSADRGLVVRLQIAAGRRDLA